MITSSSLCGSTSTNIAGALFLLRAREVVDRRTSWPDLTSIPALRITFKLSLPIPRQHGPDGSQIQILLELIPVSNISGPLSLPPRHPVPVGIFGTPSRLVDSTREQQLQKRQVLGHARVHKRRRRAGVQVRAAREQPTDQLQVPRLPA